MLNNDTNQGTATLFFIWLANKEEFLCYCTSWFQISLKFSLDHVFSVLREFPAKRKMF